MIIMPRLKGKYDRPAYFFLSPQERKARNAYYYMEKLSDRDPEFAQQWHTLANAYRAGKLTQKEADKQIWQKMREAIQKQR